LFIINIKKFLFSFLAVGFCLKNLAFARKIVALPESGGLQLPNPLARTPMIILQLPFVGSDYSDSEIYIKALISFAKYSNTSITRL